MIKDWDNGKKVYINPENITYIDETPDDITFYFASGASLRTRHPDAKLNRQWKELLAFHNPEKDTKK